MCHSAQIGSVCGITVAGTPERGAVVERAKDLVQFARKHGYRTDELVQIIENVG